MKIVSISFLKLSKLNTLYKLNFRNLSLYKQNQIKLIQNNLKCSQILTRRSLTDHSNPTADGAASGGGGGSLSAKQSRNIVAERSYFDTHLFVTHLTENGFTQKQAEQLCVMFKEIVNFISSDIKRDCVTKSGQELAIQQVMIHIGSLKKDMIILEKSEFSTLRNENEKLVLELKNFRDQLNDEIIKLKGGFTLDINLEKSRSSELMHDASNRLYKLDSRIDTEISNVKALLETFKADTIRYIAGSLFTVLVIILGALRYFTL